jgi:cytochrome b561
MHSLPHPIHATPTRVLHWLSALVLLLAAGLILARYGIDEGSTEKLLIGWHREAGAALLLLTMLRLAMRLRVTAPHHVGMAPLLERAAQAGHFGLYLLLLAVPMLGWAYSSAAGKPVDLLGITLPALLARDRDLADTLQTVHIDLAYGLLALITVHAAAALWHHFVQRDGVLFSMLPLRRLHPRLRSGRVTPLAAVEVDAVS